MAEDTIDVLVFVNEVSETSISLEVAARLADPAISQTVCSFFAPETTAFGLAVCSLDARSQLDTRAYARLYDLLCERRPDVVHVHPNATGSIVRVLARAAGIPHVVSTEHSTHGDFSALKNAVNGSTNWLNDAVVCNSETTAASLRWWERALLALSGTERRVIYNGVDIESVRRARETGPTVDRPAGFLVGTAARLVPEKNLALLVAAVGRMAETHRNVHLVIVGDGPERAALERRAAAAGIADRVHFPGYLPRESVHAVMNALDVYAFPSAYEGFGVAVAEAMAARCPVVVNDIPVLREVVGDAGVYVDATDVAAFAAALSELYDDPDERARLGERASRRVETEFSIRATAAQYADLYRTLARE